MGVSGAVGVMKRYGSRWSTKVQLRDMTVVIDTTGAFYWWVKSTFLRGANPTDKYGTSMPDLGQHYRALFRNLRARNIKPIIVYEGAPRSEREGEIVSKSRHSEYSCRAAVARLNRGHLSTSLPPLAVNCLKEVVAELDLKPDQLVQAESEVYPHLVRLAHQHRCPVLTQHTDFIFHNVPKGFALLEELVIPTEPSQAIDCTLYWHHELLHMFNLREEHSGSLGCLSVLLRDDFAETYYSPINRILQFDAADPMRLGPNARKPGLKTRRLELVLKRWSRLSLTSGESVRSALANLPNTTPHLTRDFDAVHETYSVPVAFEQANWFRMLNGHHGTGANLGDALRLRETSAEFLANLSQTNYCRTAIEDTRTHRSTFSMLDRVKEGLIERIREKPENGLRLFDRTRDRLESRNLHVKTRPLGASLDRAALFALFHFDETKLARVSSKLHKTIQTDSEQSDRLALILLLAAYTARLVPRENYCNELEDVSGPPSHPGSLGSDPNLPQANATYSSADTRLMFFTAILNSCVYLKTRSNGDESQQDIPADIRVAKEKVDKIVQEQPGIVFAPQAGYMTKKHLVEALNATIHGYKETNSLSNFPGPNLLVNKHYDATIVYKIMAKFSNNLQGFLLRLNEEILRDL